MSDPWAEFRVKSAASPKVDNDPWAEYRPAPAPQPAAAPEPVYSGSILPFSRDASGGVHFDSNAGVLGLIKGLARGAQSGATIARDVYEGKVDPTSEEGIGRAFEMATLGAPVNPAVRIGDRAIPGLAKALRRERVEPPTSDALKAAADAGYKQARELGVDYSSNAVRDMAQSLQMGLEQDGILAELAPKAHGILGKLQSPPEGSVASLSGLEAARRAFREVAGDFTNPTEQKAAQRAIQQLDEFLSRSDPASVVAGPAADAARIITDARGNYASAMRSDKITGVEEAAELRAAAANSGQNLDNSIRQRIASLLTKPKDAAGFSEAELAQLDQTARGTPVRNAARHLGNLLGGGGGLGAAVTGVMGGTVGGQAGGAAGAVVGAGLPLVGYGSKKVANALTSRALNKVDEMTRRRSPLYEQMANDAPMTVITPEGRAAVVRALLLAQGQTP